MSIEDEIVGILVSWLSENGDRDDKVEPGGLEELTFEERKQSILWGHGGLSVLPSGNFTILSTLSSVLFKRGTEGRDRLIEILNDHLDREPRAMTWQALLLRLSNAGGATPQIVSDFLRRLFEKFPALLGTREAIIFLAYAQRWDDQLVYDLLDGWETSERTTLRQALGELVGLVSIVRDSQIWKDKLEDLIAKGSPDAKTGLAYSAANLWRDDQFHEPAARLLTRLIQGADDRRTAAILDLFRVIDRLEPDDVTVDFLKALSVSEIDLSGAPSTFVVERLQEFLPLHAEIVADSALKLVKAWRSELGDIRSSAALSSPVLTDLALTLHRLGGATREAGVTVFETLIEIDAYGARDTLYEMDGRFASFAPAARARVQRRRETRSKYPAARRPRK